jgi:DNA-binding MarR family transcriptional regulator
MADDKIDKVLRESGWPHAGGTALDVISRLYRLTTYLERRLGLLYRTFGLNRGEADVLGALLRAENRSMSPSILSENLMCSAGAMTNRLDRLEDAGYIERVDDPDDRRGTRLKITRSGKAAIERAIAERNRLDADLLPGLSGADRRALVGLLRRTLVEFERETPAAQPAVATRSARSRRGAVSGARH